MTSILWYLIGYLLLILGAVNLIGGWFGVDLGFTTDQRFIIVLAGLVSLLMGDRGKK